MIVLTTDYDISDHKKCLAVDVAHMTLVNETQKHYYKSNDQI